MENYKFQNYQAEKRDYKEKTKRPNYFILSLVVLLIFYSGVAWGAKNKNLQDDPAGATKDFIRTLSNPKNLLKNSEKGKPEDVDFGIFWSAWQELERKYVDQDKLDYQAMVYGAVKGLVNSLNDPYSVFMDPDETEEFGEDISGSFEGIGAELGMKEGILTVISPIDGMPAEKAGLRAGDKIFKINGELTSEITIDEAVKRIRGPKGTEVTLTIVRNGEEKTQDLTIKRDTIELKSVIYEKKEGEIAYVRITKFSEDTSKEFNREVTKLIADGSRGLILDLRNDPGGYLHVAVEIASKFIPKGEVVVWEQGREGEKNSYKAIGGDILSEMPTVVLINEGSASASEILAGALRDIKGVKIIGSQSFGKGSVQELLTLSDGSSMRVTIAKWLTPNGTSIHDVGLKPDIEVEITEEDINNQRDSQLEKALEELKNQIK
jgi:carboxyl-terminal processing protease